MKGLPALAAAATAILGVATALYPTAPVVAALKTALPLLLTAAGSIVAAFAHPPARRPNTAA